jgi:hypothetical protein
MQKIHVDNLYEEYLEVAGEELYEETNTKTRLTSISRVNVNQMELRQRYYHKAEGQVIYLYLIPLD